MSLTIYAHPFSSYCQKGLMALWENDTPFTYRNLEEPGAGEELHKLWPIGKFPVLVDDGQTIVESSIIIEHLDRHHPGPVRFIPDDPDAALEVRLMDRFFDQHVMSPVQRPVSEAIRPDGGRKEEAIAEGLRGVGLSPISQDKTNGPYYQHQLARIYLLVGEPEKALDMLEPLLKMPYYLSPGWLRVDPTFDSLRKTPRFQRLVGGAGS